MKQLIIIPALVIIAVGVLSCRKALVGVGPAVKENRTVPNFNAIDLRIYGDVYYKNDTASKIEIIAPKNIIDMLKTTVIDHKLIIQFDGTSDRYDGDRIRINISAPYVNSLALTSSGSIYCMSDLHQENLSLRINGSGDIALENLLADDLEVINTGSGSVTALYGGVMDAGIKITGSGQVNLPGILLNQASVQNTGSGSALVKVAEYLEARISGSGSIYFRGYPYVSSHISGTGHLIHL